MHLGNHRVSIKGELLEAIICGLISFDHKICYLPSAKSILLLYKEVEAAPSVSVSIDIWYDSLETTADWSMQDVFSYEDLLLPRVINV